MSYSFEWPSRFVDLKREIASATTEEQLMSSWKDLLAELAKRTAEIAQAGTDYIVQVDFSDLEKLTPEEIEVIKRNGSIVIRNVVDSKIASSWKPKLKEFLKVNPHTTGIPADDRQFWHTYWSPSQVQAHTDPNVLKATAWLSKLFHVGSGNSPEGLDLSVPLAYADGFRIRRPDTRWNWLPPHVDNCGIELWEHKEFRRTYEGILAGNWRQHDPYEVETRAAAHHFVYDNPGRISVFRTWQGWMAMSEIAPSQGTLRVFPDVKLSNAYLLLRPFFSPTVPVDSTDIFDFKNWKFDISTPDFPGIMPMGTWFAGPMPTPELHPHLRLEETMISMPKVQPGDMVFWHCDMIHAVEAEHTGPDDSAVMYIGAVPKTALNSSYIAKQLQSLLEGTFPPDFEHNIPKEGGEFVGLATADDISKEPISRLSMGLPVEVA